MSNGSMKVWKNQFLSLLQSGTQIWLSCTPPGYKYPRKFNIFRYGLQTLENDCRTLDLGMWNTSDEIL
jgi:hypothetical protein